MAKKPKILIAIPCYEHKMYWQTGLSLWHLGHNMSKLPVQFEIEIFANTFITNARNAAASRVLHDKSFDGVLFIDADMGFHPMDVVKLFGWMIKGFSIVGGNYTFKRIHWPLVEMAVKEGITGEALAEYSAIMNSNVLPIPQQNNTEVKQVDYLGMGLTMIHRKVLDKLAETYPDRIFTKPSGEPIFPFFKVEHTELGYFGTEDAYFCRLANSVGFPSYWPQSVRPAHIGVVTFEPAKSAEEVQEAIGVDPLDV